MPTTPELLVSMNDEISTNGTSETGTGINETGISETEIGISETGISETGINDAETRINETKTGISDVTTSDVALSDSECDFDTLADLTTDAISVSVVPDAISLVPRQEVLHYYEEEEYDIDEWCDDTTVVVPPSIETGSCSQYGKCLYDTQQDHSMEDIVMTVSPQINELDFQWSD